MKTYWLAATLPMMAALACSTSLGEDDSSDDAIVSSAGQYLAQGWTDDQREKYDFTNQGSRLIPYDWLVSLEQAGNTTPFMDAKNVAHYGYIPAPVSAHNPDGLPIGFTRDEDKSNGPWAGVTCAACHTGQYTYQGKRFFVDGAQSLSDIGSFLQGMSNALNATLADNDKFTRFATAVAARTNQADDDKSRAALNQRLKDFAGTFATMTAQTNGRGFGPGRADSLNAVYNAVLSRGLGIPENAQTASTATAMPPIWLTSDLDWVQTNGNQHTPLGRDMLQAFIFAKLEVKGGVLVSHSVDFVNLHAIEEQVHNLKAPKWPSDIFGSIDNAKAQEGAKLYQANCQSCHSLAPYPMTDRDALGSQQIAVKRVPIGDIGVDPGYINAFLGRRATPGQLSLLAKSQTADDGTAPGIVLTAIVAKEAIEETFLKMAANPADVVTLTNKRSTKTPTEDDLKTVIGRPLPGVALSGYFLHNGAVRTIHQLLLPAAQREKTFFVGSTEYDPKELGFVSDSSAPTAYKFDVSAPGDSNSGHEYGTNLTEAQRYQLLEFIKTL